MDTNAGKVKYWAVAAVLVVTGVVGIYFFTQPAVAPEGITEIGHFSLVINYGDKSDSYGNIPLNSGETLFAAVQQLVTANGIEFDYEDYGDMGMLITNIGGRGDDEGGAYWQYWVNGNYAQVGASAYKIQDGDRIEWRLTDEQQ